MIKLHILTSSIIFNMYIQSLDRINTHQCSSSKTALKQFQALSLNESNESI